MNRKVLSISDAAKLLLHAVLLFVLSAISPYSWAQDQQSCKMHLAYRSLDHDKSEIQVRHYDGKQWNEQLIAHSNAAGFSYAPTVTVDSQENVLVAWVDRVGASTQLMYRAMNDREQWRDVAIEVGSVEGEKTTPVLFRSISGEVYLSWVSDENGLDDVFLSRWDPAEGWLSPAVLSQDNEFPDVTPNFEYIEDSKGEFDLSVVWQARSKDGIYQPESYVVEQGLRLEPDQKVSNEICNEELEDVSIPSSYDVGFLYTPSNLSESYRRLRNR